MIDLIPFFVVIIYGDVGLCILDLVRLQVCIVIRLDSQGCRVAVTIFSSTLASLLVVKLSQHSGS